MGKPPPKPTCRKRLNWFPELCKSVVIRKPTICLTSLFRKLQRTTWETVWEMETPDEQKPHGLKQVVIWMFTKMAGIETPDDIQEMMEGNFSYSTFNPDDFESPIFKRWPFKQWKAEWVEYDPWVDISPYRGMAAQMISMGADLENWHGYDHFYCFCNSKWRGVKATRHCWVCLECKPKNSWHCGRYNVCQPF